MSHRSETRHCTQSAQGLGLVLDAEGMLGTKRSKRYSAIVKDNVITHLNVEPDGSGEVPIPFRFLYSSVATA